ncbi:DoxX family protein [Streptomyces oceani]|uniref:DoxX family protein n=1 Tax=Streptomyces oceani TaxID=1075402 RepID=A0A1E7KI65_9ACTN|nr:DoxX family protein [Streptomyces oceani]OEV03672.1 DoxX family protein [Streptomyces oceani]
MRSRLEAAGPYVLSLFRVVVGLLFACHGFGALFGVIGPAAGPQATTVDPLSWPHGYAAVIQLVGGGLLLLGYGSRTAALISSGSMAYAYFDVHAPQGLVPLDNGGESAAFYCWAFLLLVCTGPGALSLERLLRPVSGKRLRTVDAARG